MEMLATLRQSGGINALARQLDVPPGAAMAGVKALLPPLLTRFRQYDNGFEGLLDTLAKLGGANLAAAVMAPEPAAPESGIALLAHVFSSPYSLSDELRAASQAGGGDEGLLARLFPLLAMLIGGYVSARAAAGGLTTSEIQRIFSADEESGPSGPELD